MSSSIVPTTKKQIVQLIHEHGDAIRGFGVSKLGLFGSFVRDESHAESDVDLLVEFIPDQKNLRNLVGLADFLHHLLKRKVEIITPQSLNPLIGKHIINQVEYVSLAA